MLQLNRIVWLQLQNVGTASPLKQLLQQRSATTALFVSGCFLKFYIGSCSSAAVTLLQAFKSTMLNCQSHFEIRWDLRGANCLIEVIRKCKNMENRAWTCWSSFRWWLLNLLVLNILIGFSSCFFFLFLLFFWRWSQIGSNHFPIVSFSLPYLWICLSFLPCRSLLLPSFFFRFVLPRIPSPSTLSCKCLSTVEAFRKKRRKKKAKIKYRLWFHGSMLCNWSFWLYIWQTGCKINCLPWWGNTRKTRYQRLFEVKGCLLGKNYTRQCRWHTLYIFSQHQNFEAALWLQQLPQRDFWSYEVRCFHLWPGEAIWKSSGGEWTQIHNGSPWGLPGSAQFEPPIINIPGGK